MTAPDKKFHRIRMREQELADEFELGIESFGKWSKDRDGFAAAKDTEREKFCQDMVDWWDHYLVKAAMHLAKHKSHIEAGKDGVTAEFAKSNHTALTHIYDALGALPEDQLKSGKAIFDALKPLRQEVEAPKAEAQGRMDKGVPPKKGPSA
jgi:hypothetical protein